MSNDRSLKITDRDETILRDLYESSLASKEQLPTFGQSPEEKR